MVFISSNRLILACAVVTALAGCMGDNATSCGPNMRFESALGVCVCTDTAVADRGGCRACAADEVVVGTACACAPGKIKDDGGTCVPAPGLDAPCDITTPCHDATYDFCVVRDAKPGSCTKRCSADADCPDTYVCADWEAMPSCRTYSGFGVSCTATEDCATYDATACLQGHCAVHDCTLGVDDCPRDTKCCDFSTYGLGTVCAPAGFCP